jgi:hypothetical protein
LRVDAIEALPKLVGRLTRKVQSVTEKVTERIPRANEFCERHRDGVEAEVRGTMKTLSWKTADSVSGAIVLAALVHLAPSSSNEFGDRPKH